MSNLPVKSEAVASLQRAKVVIDEMVELSDRVLVQINRTREAMIGVGVGAPGPLNQAKGTIVRAANLVGWQDVTIRDALRERLGVPVHLENDANAAAYGEFWAGDPVNKTDLVLLTLGTGVGAGIILGGLVLRGHFENAGELGHMIVNPDGPACPCGQLGCLEQYTSASSLVRRAMDAMRKGGHSSLSEIYRTNGIVSAHDVTQCAIKGDSLCSRIWAETCAYLAIGCVNIQHAFNPARILLGGGLAHAGAFLLNQVQTEFRMHIWNLGHDIPMLGLAKLGADAGTIGAAGLAWKSASTGTLAR